MAITSRKITTYAKNIADLSDQPNKDGLTAAQLKAFFDGRTDEEVKTSINGIVDDLTATTDGASGADQVGATAVGDGTAVTVQGILEEQDAKSDTIDGLVVHKADAETITGVKTFSVSPIVPVPTTDTQASTKKYVDDTDGARKTYVDNLDALAVHLAGNETITGIKTFSASPVVPAPTTDTQAATKKYVDDADVLKVNITDIVNDLTTGGTAVPLSAEQGKTLQGEVGTLASLSTTEKGSLVGAINEVDDHADTNATSIGTLASLTTTEKTNLVGAINEVDADVGTNATAIGTLASLTTTEKTNLVGAINELDTAKVETSAIANTLTETAAGKVLDARQGKALSDKIGTQTYTEDNYVTDGQSATASIDALDQAVKDNADLISSIGEIVYDSTITSNWSEATLSADPVTNIITHIGHGFTVYDAVEFRANTGTLPTGITTYDSDAIGTAYKVSTVVDVDHYKISALASGPDVALGTAGDGAWQVRRCPGSVTLTPSAAIDLSIPHDIYFMGVDVRIVGAGSTNLGIRLNGNTALRYYTNMGSKILDANYLDLVASNSLAYHLTTCKVSLRTISDRTLIEGQTGGFATTNKTNDKSAISNNFSGWCTKVDSLASLSFFSITTGGVALKPGYRVIIVRRSAT